MFFKNKSIRYIFIVSVFICVLYPVINIYFVFPTFTNLLVRNTENEAVRLGNHLSRMFFDKDGVIAKDRIDELGGNKAHTLIDDFKLMKLKLFTPSGETVYSTSESDIGKINTHDYYHNIVAKGNTFTKVAQKDTESLEGQVVTSDVVETYVPVMSEGKFIGAFEIYYDITSRNRDLHNVMLPLSAIPLGMMLMFLVFMSRILMKQDRFLIRQEEHEAELLTLNGQLEAEIIERNRAEEKMMDFADKLEQSNGELQEFAHIASHDLQEPLRKVMTFGERLKANYADVLDDKGKDYLDRMQNASRRMQNLIQGLLTLSRVATKEQPFEKVDLSNLADVVLSDLEIRIDELDGKVEVDNLPELNADPLQMRQLIQNLIGNALKFHKEGEHPVVKVTYEKVTQNEDESEGDTENRGYHQIMIKDNGIGFEQEYADRIFGVFQRLHGRTEYEGTGIGLSVCKKIVERHGGNITVTSSPGNGAAFVVTLPITDQETTAPGEDAE